MQSEGLRLFVALSPPEEVQRALVSFQRSLVPALPGLSFVRQRLEGAHGPHYHLTLHFIGAAHGDTLPGVCAALEAVVGRFGPLRLRLGELGWFARGTAVRVLYIGLGGDTGPLAGLAAELSTALGADSGQVRFHPHITLARGPRRGQVSVDAVKSALPTLIPLPGVDFVADKIILFNSVLTREGPRYSILQGFPLGTR